MRRRERSMNSGIISSLSNITDNDPWRAGKTIMDRWVLATMLSRLGMSESYRTTLTPPPDANHETAACAAAYAPTPINYHRT